MYPYVRDPAGSGDLDSSGVPKSVHSTTPDRFWRKASALRSQDGQLFFYIEAVTQ
jgi:hypothetical protein